ncbi:hypothetical protein COR50_06910 [Chitinophaga caeni]|uniref:histidine kinase n=1 Tax=Chitinophaga caeni TaxID=2029983 RepID=A0A291QST2_9BACT|nr:hypothetical protein COR50_06910 [Chitinophaga caeni]
MKYPAIKILLLFIVCALFIIVCFQLFYVPVQKLFPSYSPLLLGEILLGAIFLLTCILLFISVHSYTKHQQSYSKQYKQLFDEHPVPMWIYDTRSLKFLSVNQATIQKYGYSEDEFLDMTIAVIRPTEDVPKLYEDIHQTKFDIPYRGIWRHKKRDGTVFSVEVYSHSTSYRGKPGRIVMAIDIDTEIKSTITATEFGTRYELLSKMTPDSIYYFNINTREVARNHGPYTIFGYDKEKDIVNTFEWWETNIHPEDKEQVMSSFSEHVKNKKQRWKAEYRFRCADGSYKDVLDRAYLVYHEDTSLMYIIGAQQDITERKQIIQQLRQQNKVLREIAWSNSHEVRSPLVAILGIVKCMKEDMENNRELDPTLVELLSTSAENLDQVLHKIQSKVKDDDQT